jgi:hypothetical protein
MNETQQELEYLIETETVSRKAFGGYSYWTFTVQPDSVKVRFQNSGPGNTDETTLYPTINDLLAAAQCGKHWGAFAIARKHLDRQN